MRLIYFIILMSFSFAFSSAAQSGAQLTPYHFKDSDVAQLQSGEAVTHVWRDKSRNDGALDVFGAIDIMAPPHIIWNIMIDCSRGMNIIKKMKSCDVLETSENGNWDIRRQVFDMGLLPNARTIFRSDYDPLKSIKISRVQGDLKRQDGLWSILPGENGKTRVTYRARVQLKFLVPRAVLKRATQKDTPEIMRNLRRISEAEALKSK